MLTAMNPNEHWQRFGSTARSLDIELRGSQYEDQCFEAKQGLTKRQSSLASVWF